jgi:transcription antitermination factor NusG
LEEGLVSGESGLRWYALYVRSRHEKSVHAQLDAKSEDAFLPLYCGKHKWADRWKKVSLPLFPGYVFCRFDANRRSSVLATSGVIDVVRIGSQPAAIDACEVEAIRRVVKSSLPTEPHAGLIKGAPVMMSDGPLKGMSGTLMEVRKGLRLVISIELLRRSVLIEIDQDWVFPEDLCSGKTRAFSEAIDSGRTFVLRC